MRTFIALFLICISSSIFACIVPKPDLFAVETGIKAKCQPYNAWTAYRRIPSWCEYPYAMSRSRVSVLPLSIFTFYRLDFDRGAVFCRMESYTQRKYGVKFSFHAGGYQE